MASVSGVQPAKKPGYKSSEFWITILTVLASSLGGLTNILPDSIAGTVAAISTIAYTISRGLAKR